MTDGPLNRYCLYERTWVAYWFDYRFYRKEITVKLNFFMNFVFFVFHFNDSLFTITSIYSSSSIHIFRHTIPILSTHTTHTLIERTHPIQVTGTECSLVFSSVCEKFEIGVDRCLCFWCVYYLLAFVCVFIQTKLLFVDTRIQNVKNQ